MIKIVRIGAQNGAHAIQYPRPKTAALPQLRQALIDEVVAYMRTACRDAFVDIGLLRRILCHRERRRGDFYLIHERTLRYLGNGEAVHIPAFEIHTRIGIGWILRRISSNGTRGSRMLDPHRKAHLMQAIERGIESSIAFRPITERSGSLSENLFQKRHF